MAKLEQEIHSWLTHNAFGVAKNVVGLSQTTLSKMKRGNSGMKMSTLKSVLESNGHEAIITIKHQNGKRTTINLTKIKENGERGEGH